MGCIEDTDLLSVREFLHVLHSASHVAELVINDAKLTNGTQLIALLAELKGFRHPSFNQAQFACDHTEALLDALRLPITSPPFHPYVQSHNRSLHQNHTVAGVCPCLEHLKLGGITLKLPTLEAVILSRTRSSSDGAPSPSLGFLEEVALKGIRLRPDGADLKRLEDLAELGVLRTSDQREWVLSNHPMRNFVVELDHLE